MRYGKIGPVPKNDFEEVYALYFNKIFRFLYFKTKDLHLAEDIVCEVFARAWKNWEKFKPDYTQAWFYRIANNLLIDHWRKNKNRRTVSLENLIEIGHEPSFDEEFIEKISIDMEIKRVYKALEKLAENLREVLVLRVIDNLSAKEVAEILKISEGNVRTLQYRGLKRLKEILQNE